jgi:hypothetical protein
LVVGWSSVHDHFGRGMVVAPRPLWLWDGRRSTTTLIVEWTLKIHPNHDPGGEKIEILGGLDAPKYDAHAPRSASKTCQNNVSTHPMVAPRPSPARARVHLHRDAPFGRSGRGCTITLVVGWSWFHDHFGSCWSWLHDHVARGLVVGPRSL